MIEIVFCDKHGSDSIFFEVDECNDCNWKVHLPRKRRFHLAHKPIGKIRVNGKLIRKAKQINRDLKLLQKTVAANSRRAARKAKKKANA